MINGMTILNETIYYSYNELAVLFSILIPYTICVIIALCFDLPNRHFWTSWISTLCIVVLCMLVTYRVTAKELHEYQVVFSEDVKINDVFDKYNIVYQNENVYTIREKQ